MNKTIQINLAGRSLQIDENAFSTLQDYLERVQSSLKDQEGSEEIFQEVMPSHGRFPAELRMFLRPF